MRLHVPQTLAPAHSEDVFHPVSLSCITLWIPFGSIQWIRAAFNDNRMYPGACAFL